MHKEFANPEDILDVLKKVGAIITDDHFVYTAGQHGSAYINKDALYPHARMTSRLCRAIAQEFIPPEYDIEVVIAPAVGAIVLSHSTALHLCNLSLTKPVSLYAEKLPGKDEFIIGRGYDKFVTGKRVLVVEDILNTGGSVRKVVDAVRQIGGNVVAVAALCNRGNVRKEDIGNPPHLFTLCSLTLEAWNADECPLCAAGVPINTELGKGRKFLAEKGTS